MDARDTDREHWFKALGRDKETSDKSWETAVVLSVLLGWLGADRLYLGSAWLGILKFCTLGGFGVWWVVDIVLLLQGAMRDGEGRAMGGPSRAR